MSVSGDSPLFPRLLLTQPCNGVGCDNDEGLMCDRRCSGGSCRSICWSLRYSQGEILPIFEEKWSSSTVPKDAHTNCNILYGPRHKQYKFIKKIKLQRAVGVPRSTCVCVWACLIYLFTQRVPSLSSYGICWGKVREKILFSIFHTVSVHRFQYIWPWPRFDPVKWRKLTVDYLSAVVQQSWPTP